MKIWAQIIKKEDMLNLKLIINILNKKKLLKYILIN